MFVLYATVDKHVSYDRNTLTRELFKVTHKGAKDSLAINLSKAGNDSWSILNGGKAH
jgi:hypothetical protein